MLNRKIQWEEQGGSGLGEAAPASVHEMMPGAAKKARVEGISAAFLARYGSRFHVFWGICPEVDRRKMKWKT